MLNAALQLRQHHPFLRLVRSHAMLVTGLANLVRLDEENSAAAFVGVDLRRQRRVFEISSVTKPAHSGSNGVTFTMIPPRASVDVPTQMVSTSRGILRYSTDRASANEFDGTIATSHSP